MMLEKVMDEMPNTVEWHTPLNGNPYDRYWMVGMLIKNYRVGIGIEEAVRIACNNVYLPKFYPELPKSYPPAGCIVEYKASGMTCVDKEDCECLIEEIEMRLKGRFPDYLLEDTYEIINHIAFNMDEAIKMDRLAVWDCDYDEEW